MKNKNNIFDVKLDPEEQALSESLEKDEWKTVDNFKEEVALAKEAAINYLRKDARVNIRISKSDLERLRQKAAYKGLPYQTLISSILHEYAAGHFEGKL
jgi:predicted DNA binding CopG/RHH family protein